MKLHTLMVELTTACNMRCIYCELSHPYWQPAHLSQLAIERLIEFVTNNNVFQVCLHGQGEITMAPNWCQTAKRFLIRDTKLVTCTNLNKILSPEEVNTFACFASITVSIDTADPELFKMIRRGGDLNRILRNIISITQTAKQLNNVVYWIWNAVITNRNIHKLMDLCVLAHAYKIGTLIFSNLIEITPPIPQAADLQHPSTLPTSEIIIKELADCKKYCDDHQIILEHQSLLETLWSKVN